MTISFSQRGNVIQARLTDGAAISLRLSTGIKSPGHIKFHQGKFIGGHPDAAVLNHDLNRQKVIIADLYRAYRGDLEKVKELYTPQLETALTETVDNSENYNLIYLLQRFLSLAKKGEIKSKENRPFSQQTIAIYFNAVKCITAYSEIAGGLDLMEMNIHPRDEISKKMQITKKWEDYFRAFDDYMIDERLHLSTRALYLNNISIIVNYWKNKLYFQLPKIASYRADPKPVVVLEPKFVKHFLTEEKTYTNMEDKYKYTWEICATILVTTMRIEDAMGMSVSDLHITRDAMFLSKMNGKTREYTNVPIPKFLEKIYRENLTRYGRIFTLQAVPYNSLKRYIKTVFSMYPEMHQLATIKTFGIHGEEVTDVGPMYEHVHFHMLRKTAITTMIYHKVSERHIKFCSGHSLKSTHFERYVAFVEKHFKSEVSQFYKDFLDE